MLENAADVVQRALAQIRVLALFKEQILAALPQTLVHVHARSVVLKNRFGHQRDRLVVPPRHLFDDVFVFEQVVPHLQQGIEPHVDLGLSRRPDLVMLHLDLHADLFEREQHLRADVLELVHRRNREVALFEARLVAEVRVLLASGIPESLDRVDVVVGMVVALSEADVVEDVEFRLGAEVRGVGDPAGLQVLLGLLRDAPRIARVPLAGHGILDVADQHQRGSDREGIEERGIWIRHEEHVAFLNLLKASNARAVEPQALFEGIRAELFGRHREVLPQPRQVDEPDIHGLHVFLLNQRHHISTFHRSSFRRWMAQPSCRVFLPLRHPQPPPNRSRSGVCRHGLICGRHRVD